MNEPDCPVRLLSVPARLRCLALAAIMLLTPVLLACLAPRPALAEPIRVSAAADAGADLVQARQQAQARAFVEAVFQTALKLLPAPLPVQRAELLRQFLTPRATALVVSFQEAAPVSADKAAPARLAASAKSSKGVSAEKAEPLSLELDVEVDRTALRDLVSRLGLLAGTRHPGGFAVRLGAGVAEADLKPLADVLALQGLARRAQAPVQVSLERLPQGYLKAVLWAGAKSYAADGQDLGQLWLDLWGKYLSAREQQPGGQGSPIEVSGFSQADAVLEFTKTLMTWDDCLREVQLNEVDIRAGNSTGRWSARLTNPERLNARLNEYLPSRKLTAAR